MNSKPKIYDLTGSCVARSFRALKRKLKKKSVTGTKFYVLVGKEQSRENFDIVSVKRGSRENRDCLRVKFASHE